MKIENHLLVGEGISFRESPNHSGILEPRYLVMHYTAAPSADNAVQALCNPTLKASAHLVLGRDGSFVQLVPFNVVAWHAGVSQWNGLVGLNQHSIGIEMDNAGLLKRVGSQFVAWFGRRYPEDEVLLAAHRHGGGVQPWHTYSEVQIERALELAELLAAHYGLEDVLGHEDVARGRKSDPGPAFPLEALRSRAVGRKDDAPATYVVTATSLNIRSGPGVEHATVAPPLRQGTRVALLEPGDRWSRVEVEGSTDVEGWVNNKFITRADHAASVLAMRQAATAADRAPRPAPTARGTAPAVRRAPAGTAPTRRASRGPTPRGPAGARASAPRRAGP